MGEGFDAESRDEVLKIEAALQEAIAAGKLADHPAIKTYLDWIYKEILECKEMLSEDQSLDEKARSRLFERIKQCKQTLRAFGGRREDIELLIKQKLAHATSQTA